PEIAEIQSGDVKLTPQMDHSLLVDPKFASTETPYKITLKTKGSNVAGIRLEVLPDPTLPNNGPGLHTTGNFHLSEVKVFSHKNELPRESAISRAQASYAWKSRPVEFAIDQNPQTEWHVWGRLGESHQAIFWLESPATVAPEHPLVVELHFRPGLALGRFRLAITSQPNSEAIDTARTISDPWRRLTATLHLAEETEALKKLLVTHPDAILGLADMHVASKKWNQALTIYNEVIGPQTQNMKLLVSRAKIYAELGAFDKAKADWLEATRIEPQLARQAFDAFTKLERWEDASEFGLKVIEKTPDESELLLHLAPVLYLAGDEAAYTKIRDQAITRFENTTSAYDAERVISISLLPPTFQPNEKLPIGVMNLALDEGKLTDEFSSVGWTCRALLTYRQGDWKTAIQYAETQLQKSNIDPVSNARRLAVLAMAHHQLGNTEESKFAFQQLGQEIEKLKSQEMTGPNKLLPIILHREAQSIIQKMPL
ncbi:MAG: hypothetical protein KDA84_25465, partial [Planctomycetaceae bacterium]|nr:hypothetical protein [Planctomycetaceae bacterium]